MMANPYPSGLDMSLIAWDPNMVQGAAILGWMFWWICYTGHQQLDHTVCHPALVSSQKLLLPAYFHLAELKELMAQTGSGNQKLTTFLP